MILGLVDVLLFGVPYATKPLNLTVAAPEFGLRETCCEICVICRVRVYMHKANSVNFVCYLSPDGGIKVSIKPVPFGAIFRPPALFSPIIEPWEDD